MYVYLPIKKTKIIEKKNINRVPYKDYVKVETKSTPTDARKNVCIYRAARTIAKTVVAAFSSK